MVCQIIIITFSLTFDSSTLIPATVEFKERISVAIHNIGLISGAFHFVKDEVVVQAKAWKVHSLDGRASGVSQLSADHLCILIIPAIIAHWSTIDQHSSLTRPVSSQGHVEVMAFYPGSLVGVTVVSGLMVTVPQVRLLTSADNIVHDVVGHVVIIVTGVLSKTFISQHSADNSCIVIIPVIITKWQTISYLKLSSFQLFLPNRLSIVKDNSIIRSISINKLYIWGRR